MAVTLSSLNRLSEFFHSWFICKFAVKWPLKMPPHRTRVATLPCEIYVQVIAMLKNCVNKPSRKTQTAMQDSSTENYSGKNTRLMMWPLFNSITDRMWLPQQRKKASQQNPFAHHQVQSQSLMVLVGKSKSVYPILWNKSKSMQQQLPTAVSCHTQDIWQVLNLSAGHCQGTQSAWGNRLSFL